MNIRTQLITLLVLLCVGCQSAKEFEADSFGNTTHADAIMFFSEEGSRYTSDLYREKVRVRGIPPSEAGKVPDLPAPRGELKELIKAARMWKDRVPKKDRELRLIYIRFQKVYAGYEILYKSLGDDVSFDSYANVQFKRLKKLAEAVQIVENRPEKYRIKE